MHQWASLFVQVQYVMAQLQSNDVGAVCTWFCDHDVQADMERAALAQPQGAAADDDQPGIQQLQV